MALSGHLTADSCLCMSQLLFFDEGFAYNATKMGIVFVKLTDFDVFGQDLLSRWPAVAVGIAFF